MRVTGSAPALRVAGSLRAFEIPEDPSNELRRKVARLQKETKRLQRRQSAKSPQPLALRWTSLAMSGTFTLERAGPVDFTLSFAHLD